MISARVPDEADSVDTAIILAMDYLGDWLVIHDEAPQGLDGINLALQATVRGNTTWRGFRSSRRVRGGQDGGFAGSFYDWCKSDPPMGWPASQPRSSRRQKVATFRTTRRWRASFYAAVSDRWIHPPG